MADEITLEQDIDEAIGLVQPAEAEALDVEELVEASAAEPEDEEDEGSEDGDVEDDED